MNQAIRMLTALSLAFLMGGTALAAENETKAEPAATASSAKGEQSPMIEVVDIPTAEILEPMTYSTAFRFYNDGGLASRLVIGPLKRVTGSGDPHLIRPSVFFKLKFFDGNDFLPAMALGYDNQGFLYQENTRQFLQREKGLYLAGSHEILIPNLELHAGVNVYDFDSHSAVYGFFGATFKITPSFALLSEYDNIRNGLNNRFNAGGRYWVAPYFNVYFAARNIGRGISRGAERILRLNYVGHFPM